MNWRSDGALRARAKREPAAAILNEVKDLSSSENCLMPLVQITMLQGRTAEQKRKIAKRVTDALVEEAGARREGIIVAFHEVSKESYASGGELMIDKVK
jgi:4-oxalocrotonate tautomerase